MASFVIPARFNGPPESGNGGWTSGRVAAELPAPNTGPYAVSVRLRTPPPLDRLLVVSAGGEGDEGGEGGERAIRVHDGSVLVATAVAAPAVQGPLEPPVSYADAVASGASYEGLADHPFPTCYSCGTARTDGLSLRPGRVAGRAGAYAAAWTPAEVSPEIVWAALDCPGGWAGGVAEHPMVLGTMTATISALPEAGEPHVVMAWRRGSQGRKHHTGTALYAAGSGRLLARADATWITVDPSTVRPA